MPPPARRWAGLVLALLAALACRGPESATEAPRTPDLRALSGPPTVAPSEADRERYARRNLEDARTFMAQGRMEAAERALRRGLSARPDDPALHDALAKVLAELGRPEEAEPHRQRAEALDPPLPPPPDGPLVRARGVLVALIPPRAGDPDAAPLAATWPEGEVARALEARLRTRLPGARIAHTDLESVDAARGVLERSGARSAVSLRVDRAYCADTRKDGPFAVAWLRFAGEIRGAVGSGADIRREIVMRPRASDGCREEALARALEGALAAPTVERALAARAARGAAWSRGSIRALFPGIGARIEEELRGGRRLLAAGEIEGALESFRRAKRLDAGDPNVVAYLREAELTLSLARQLASRGGVSLAPEGVALDPRLSQAQRAAAERLLEDERRRRGELLAALAVLDEDLAPPPAETFAALHASEAPDPDAFALEVARRRADSVETRDVYTPGRGLLARYYFEAGSHEPLVREEDTDGNGVPDRWIGYAGGARREIWEDGRGRGWPDAHFVFAQGGAPVEQIEIDSNGDGRADRVFHYADGNLVREARDTDGDGSLDRFDQLDPDGNVDLREEDLNGDGEIDIRSVYRRGKLVKREISDPAFLPGDT